MSIQGFSGRGMILGLLLALLTVPPVKGDDPGPGSTAKRLLFDGKSLDGWKKVDTYKAGEAKVVEGSIVLEAGGPMTAITCARTDLPTTDYELSFEAKRTTGSDFFAAATFPVGQSFVTLVNGGWSGSVTGLSNLNGADASENDTRKFVKYENGRWYQFRIQVSEQVIRCWIDDQATVAVNHQDLQLKTRLETRPCQPLGFASYRSTGMIRKVEVRSLNVDEIRSNNQSVER